MTQVRLAPLPPLPVPAVSEARVGGDVLLSRRVQVFLGGLAVGFERDPETGDWVGQGVVAAERGAEVDGRLVERVRWLALEALRAEVYRVTGEGEPPPTRCPECGRLLQIAPPPPGAELHIVCGPEHVVTWRPSPRTGGPCP